MACIQWHIRRDVEGPDYVASWLRASFNLATSLFSSVVVFGCGPNRSMPEDRFMSARGFAGIWPLRLLAQRVVHLRHPSSTPPPPPRSHTAASASCPARQVGFDRRKLPLGPAVSVTLLAETGAHQGGSTGGEWTGQDFLPALHTATDVWFSSTNGRRPMATFSDACVRPSPGLSIPTPIDHLRGREGLDECIRHQPSYCVKNAVFTTSVENNRQKIKLWMIESFWKSLPVAKFKRRLYFD